MIRWKNRVLEVLWEVLRVDGTTRWYRALERANAGHRLSDGMYERLAAKLREAAERLMTVVNPLRELALVTVDRDYDNVCDALTWADSRRVVARTVTADMLRANLR